MANDWTFSESREAPVVTTKRILAGGPILTVRHESNGEWRFLDAGSTKDEDTASVELGQFVDSHPWVTEFADLPAGSTASREHVMAPWERTKG